MGTTTRGYPYPEPAAITDVPGDILALATAVDTDVAALGDTYQRLVALAQVTATQATIGPTETDLTGLTVTHDTALNHRYRYRAFIPLLEGTDGDVYQLRLTNASNVRAQGSNVRITADGQHVALEHITALAAAGTSTVKLRLVRISGAGTVDLTATSSLTASLTAEDLGQ